jgi:hypothetical protein
MFRKVNNMLGTRREVSNEAVRKDSYTDQYLQHRSMVTDKENARKNENF